MRRRWWLGAGVAAAVVVGGVLWEARHDAAPAPPEAGFVGSDACRGCHPAAFEAWSHSFHARNGAPPSAASVVGDFEDANTYTYAGTASRMFREGDAWKMAYTDPRGETEVRTIDLVIGRARHQVYLTRLEDGRLQVLPTYWNVEEGRWRDAREGTVDGPSPLPVDHQQYWRNYGRTFQRGCLECHGSQPRKHYDRATQQYASTFDPAINCEACHGPGAAHVAAWQALDGDAARGTLPDLVRLDLDGSIEACAPCHARKRVYAEGFAPGDDFYDFFAPHVWEPGMFFADGRSSSLNYRWVDYMQNGCFRRTTRRMDCGFCHPPHGLESVKDATVTQANAICTGCHVGHKTQLVEHTHHPPESEGSRCVECHMPPMPLDLRMTVRDHTIGSPLPELTRDFGAPNACNGCHDDHDAEWAQGYVEQWYGGDAHFEGYRARMRARAEVLSQALVHDAPVPVAPLVAWLGDAGRTVVERASAAHFLRRAPTDPSATAALLAAVASDPHPLVRYAACDGLETHRTAEADAALRRALEDPRRIVRVRAYQALILRDPRVADEAALADVRAEYEVRERVIRADDPRSKSLDALWYFQRGEVAKAEATLREGVAMTWPVPGVRADLVQFLLEQGRLDEAEREIVALEEANPKGIAARSSRAVLHLARGRPADALPLLDALLDEGVRTPLIQQARDAAAARVGAAPRMRR